MPPPTTAPRAVKLGFDEDEFGTVTVSEDGTRFDFAGPNVDALKDSVRHYAEILARDAKDDNALKGIKPDMILDLMLECMQGRAWCVDAEAAPGDDPDDDDVDDDDGTDVYDDEPAPEPVEGEVENSDGAPVAGYTFADNGLLVPVGNVFCATGPGGGVDPTCSTGEGNRYDDDDFSGRTLAGRAAVDTENRKVLKDGSGRPVVVFHGTDKDFDQLGGVTYHSPDPRYGFVAKGKNVHASFLELKNPHHTDHLAEVERAGYDTAYIAELKARGHDGVVYSKKGDVTRGPSGFGNDYPQYVAFDPTAVVKIGKYDRDDFDWRLERGDFS